MVFKFTFLGTIGHEKLPAFQIFFSFSGPPFILWYDNSIIRKNALDCEYWQRWKGGKVQVYACNIYSYMQRYFFSHQPPAISLAQPTSHKYNFIFSLLLPSFAHRDKNSTSSCSGEPWNLHVSTLPPKRKPTVSSCRHQRFLKSQTHVIFISNYKWKLPKNLTGWICAKRISKIFIWKNLSNGLNSSAWFIHLSV